MCRACQGNFPTTDDHRLLSSHAARLRSELASGEVTADDPSFVAAIVNLDHERFSGSSDKASPEWGHPQTAPATRRIIFSAGYPSALTLFVLTSASYGISGSVAPQGVAP